MKKFLSCDGKARYDKKGATTVVNHAWGKRGTKLKAYWCNLCNWWHVTHKSRWGNKLK